VARFLVTRAALLSVRLDRSAREEAGRITLDMLEANEVEEDVRAQEFDRLTIAFAEHPAESVRKLRRSEEGIGWLIEEWRSARRDLVDANAFRWKAETGVRLMAQDADQAARGSRLRALSMAICGNFCRLEPTDWPDLEPLERRAAAKAEILGLIEGEIAGLEKARENLDPKRIAQARAGAAARAIFNPDKEATLARKYEAAAERGFFQTLKKIEAINATAAEAAEVEVEATSKEDETCEELASSLPAPVDRVGRFEMPEARDHQDPVGKRSVVGGPRSERKTDDGLRGGRPPQPRRGDR
jgi:hypothetical protein